MAGRKSGSSRDGSRSGVFLPSEPSESSHVPAPSIIVCRRSLVNLLSGLGDRLGSSDIAHADWYPAYAIINFNQAKGQGVAVQRLGNVTTSYTVLYSSNPVGVGCCLAVLRRRALSCLPGGWCRVLMALSVAVSGYSGPLGASFLASPSLSIFFFLCPDSLVLDLSIFCPLSLVSDFLSAFLGPVRVTLWSRSSSH